MFVGLEVGSSEEAGWRLLFRVVYYPKITFQTWRLGSRLGGGLLIKCESGSSGRRRPAAPIRRGIQTHSSVMRMRAATMGITSVLMMTMVMTMVMGMLIVDEDEGDDNADDSRRQAL